MTSYKLYKPLVLSLSLALAACGSDSDDSEETITPEVTTPEVTTPESTLSVANPIDDIELILGEKLEFSIAEDTCVDTSGAAISYNLTYTNNVGLSLVGSSITSFTRLEGVADETGVVNVTATCSTATDSLTDEFTVTVVESEFSPTVSLSFPLAFGTYNEDALDMFGNVEAATGTTLNSVTVFVDDVETETTLNADKTAWRVNDVTLTGDSKITIVADATITASSESIQQYEEITFNSNTVFKTTIDENISDIAVNESTGDIYVSSENTSVEFMHFNINTSESSDITFTRPAGFAHLNKSPTSITLDTSSNDLLVSYQAGISKIDLATYQETEVSNENLGSGTTPVAIFDLYYDSTNDVLYALDLNEGISAVNVTTGDRTVEIAKNTSSTPLSLAVNSQGDIYYSTGTGSTDDYDIFLNGAEILNTAATGAAISDLTINEAGSELFYVDGNGDLLMLDITNVSPATPTVLIADLFIVENVLATQTPLIGLHYDTKRNVIIAAGRDADGTNKLLVIDPVSGDYAKVATGTVDAD